MNPLVENLSTQLGLPTWLIVFVLAWTLTWKGLALWKAARKDHKIWFVVILVIQSLGLFEILYIFLFSKIDLNFNSKTQGGKKRANKVQKTSARKTSR